MYVKRTVPVDLKAGTYFDGACLTEDTTVDLSACDPMVQCLLDPPPIACNFEDIPPSPEVQKLCDLLVGITTIADCLEIIKTNPIAAIDGDLVDLKKCTEDGRPLVFYASTNEITGEVTFTTYVLESGDLIPYTGTDCVECNHECIRSEYIVYCGPQMGCTLYNKVGQTGFFYFDPTTGNYEELDTVANDIGKPADTIDDPSDLPGVTCYIENVSANVCNDNPDAPLVLTSADILALIAGETYNNPAADEVDFTLEGQELLSASVNSFPQRYVVKKADGTDFTSTTASVCVLSSGGDRQDLMQGGNHALGDTQTTMPAAPILVDESIEIACGSAARFCFTMRMCENADGEVLVGKAGGGFVAQPKGAVKGG